MIGAYTATMSHRPHSLLLAFLVVVSPLAAADTIVAVTQDDCARLVAHVASADVAYQPGVDVNGNAVASADLDDEGRLDLGADDITLNIGVPIVAFSGTVGDESKVINQGGKIGGFDATAGIGAVTLSGGVVHFNGRSLRSPEARRLAAACGNR